MSILQEHLKGVSFEGTFLISVFVHVLVLMWISTSENTVNNLESPTKARVNIRYESPLNQHSDKTKPQFFEIANNVWETIQIPITNDMIRGIDKNINKKLTNY